MTTTWYQLWKQYTKTSTDLFLVLILYMSLEGLNFFECKIESLKRHRPKKPNCAEWDDPSSRPWLWASDDDPQVENKEQIEGDQEISRSSRSWQQRQLAAEEDQSGMAFPFTKAESEGERFKEAVAWISYGGTGSGHPSSCIPWGNFYCCQSGEAHLLLLSLQSEVSSHVSLRWFLPLTVTAADGREYSSSLSQG